MIYLRRAVILSVALVGLIPMTVTAQDFMSAPSADAAPQLLAAPPQGQVPPGQPPQGQPPAQAAPAYTQQVEAAYRQAWQSFCSRTNQK